MPAPATVEEFLECGRRSGALDADALDACVARLRDANGLPANPVKAARALVRDGVMTRFQAEQFLRGRWRGLVISGKYVLLGPLGSGGMGHVYLCEHKVMRRRVAIKVLPDSQAEGPATLERFRREARAVAALDHPNIVRAYDIDHDDKMHFLVMEYVDGCSLEELVQKEGALEVGRACEYAHQAALGLQHAHEAGLIHRDVKPANLLVDRQGVVKILDLGLARFFHDGADNLTRQQDPHTILGTADYLSPEQALDSHDVDIRSDIYSLGLTLYFLLKGKSPFDDGKSVAQKLLCHQTRVLDPLTAVRPEVPEGLAAVVAKMSAKDADERYQEPAEVAEALAPWLPASAAGAKDTHGGRSAKTAPQPPRKPTATVKTAKAAPPVRPSAKLAAAPKAAPEGVTAEPAPRRPERDARRPARPARRLKKAGGLFRNPAALWGTVAAVSLLAVALLVGGLVWAFSGKRSATRPAVAAAMPQPGARPAQPAPPRVVGPDPHLTRVLEGHTQAVESLALSPDGRRLLSGSVDRTTRLWDLRTGECVRTFTRFRGAVWSVSFSPDGRLALTTAEPAEIKLWDLNTGAEVRRFVGHKAAVRSAAFTHDGRFVVSGSYDRTVRVWDAATGQEVKCSEELGKGAWWVTLAPDDRHVFVADMDGVTRMLETGTLRVVREFDGHGGKDARRLALSADGKRLLSCGFDGTLRLWDVDGGRQLASFDNAGHYGESCGFTPDGQSVFCTEGPSIDNVGFLTDDQGVRFWDVATQRPLFRFGGVPGKVHQALFTADGQSLMAANGDKLIRVWRLPR
jgi:WD40 repeat protein/tRNA A-37 threonylcarbamoyl transferase component Bud32